ncbi:MAG TPA: Gp138 family membrane-puncturing spike protein [Polyangiaceae bacterium]|nr:Gp138 family membrane-puncturing spike protein [Polyangiaceae bacterium]
MPLEPTLAEVLDDHRQAILGELHTCMPGRVKSYDAAKQVADVVPCLRGTIPDAEGETIHEDLPVIPNVPVAWPRGGGYYLHLPLAAGDHVWLVFNEASIAQWRATGEVSDPGDLRRGSLSYPFALPGAAPDKAKLSDAPASGEAVFGVPGGGVFRVGGPAATLVALAQKVDQALAQLKSAITTAAGTESGAGGLGGMSALNGALSSWPGPTVAATKLKAE